MDTINAIKFIKEKQCDDLWDIWGDEHEKLKKEYNDIIILLLEGEKYKQIWEEVYKELIDNLDYPLTYMDDIKQKYFPSATISV